MPTTLYRGMYYETFDPDDFAHDLANGRLDQFVLTAVQSFAARDISQFSSRFGDEGKGIGVHWTRSRSIAEGFADRFRGKISMDWSGSLPVVIEAQADEADALDPSEVHAFGWNGKDEQEVPLRPGAPVYVVRASMLIPRDAKAFVEEYEEEGVASTSDTKWHTVSMGFAALAGKRVDTAVFEA